MHLRCLAPALLLACGRKDTTHGDHSHWKEPRTPYIENHGAKLPLPRDWRAEDDEVFDEGYSIDRSLMGDHAFAHSDDGSDVAALQWLPTAEDVCATAKVGVVFETWAVKVDRIDKLPDGCKISAEIARAYFRKAGDHTLRFDCTISPPAQCDLLWREIVLS